MKELYPLFGIVSVLNTPFRSDNSIDYKALKANTRSALDAGVAGFLVPAMASEVYKLSFEERIRMVDSVLYEVNGIVPVFAGAGESDIVKAGKLIRSYLNTGCKNILFQIPFQNAGQFTKQFMELAEFNPDVIMLQDWDPVGYGLPDDLIIDLFEKVESFRCLKIETVPAGVKYSRIKDFTAGNLNLSGGWAVTQMMEGLNRGVHAFMPTGMHRIYTTVYNWFISGKVDEAEELFEKILPVLSFSNQHLDISIHFFKRLLYRQGIYPTYGVREPILPFDRVHTEICDRLIERVIEIENQLIDSVKVGK